MPSIAADLGTAASLQDARELPKDQISFFRETDLNFSVLRLTDGQVYVLRKDHPKYPGWIELMKESMDGEPLYIEFESGTNRVQSMLVPLPRRIQHIAAGLKDGYLTVNLLFCPSVCYLRESLGEEKFKSFRELLVHAWRNGLEVLVTTRPATMDILDVRAVPSEPSRSGSISNGPAITVAQPEKMLLSKRRLAPASGEVTLAEARQEFDDLAQNQQIPFGYIRDCCTARAHEMCRLMILDGMQPRKVWNYGHGWSQPHKPATLRVNTNAVPEGFVAWCYHVAPLLGVRTAGGTLQQMVIDPSLFHEPVTIADWLAIQEDVTSVQRRKVEKFIWFDFLTQETILDPDFAITRRQFRHHRAAANDANH